MQEAPSKTHEPRVRLAATHPAGYHPGRSFPVRAAWLNVQAFVLLNPIITSYPFTRWVLRLFVYTGNSAMRVGTRVLTRRRNELTIPAGIGCVGTLVAARRPD